ncbi:porphobilinogen synthase [Thermosyntropha lipolytica DSM 11003]|uniref:Delta-aminolevulinic acid dehydratase n=1 Tax=Thermosyntropha lipolytica DSM 11003 TaxID=1123382 RepID=A0A1M5NJ50_9FIRM|nr:porphobilinogen synthase [Thermosyntropha lipolytica]SHG89551.1 porphobilinogen synthase [Thermosyntropha lipolytica DSM 11003]
MSFPVHRMRRLRQNEIIRSMVRETVLLPEDFIYPLFIVYGEDKKQPVKSMPGVFQLSRDRLQEEIDELKYWGIKAVLLFGIPEYKDEVGSSGYQENGVVQEAIKTIKDLCPDMYVITDVCLCEYTDHGHCGVLDAKGNIDNDATLELLALEALSHVKAGCDMVAPSDMMDGRVGYIRKRLDEEGFSHIPIMSYAAKFCSAFYGPFREAAESAPRFGDRRTYQMDPANAREALREVALDIEEGADIVMVKPALAYLDVIKAVKEKFGLPTAAYNVSGEYAMIKAAALNGWLDEEKVMLEVLTSIKRAGADLIITYAAKDAARIIRS